MSAETPETEPKKEDWYWGWIVYQHLKDMLAQVTRHLEWHEHFGHHVMETTIPELDEGGFWATRLTLANVGWSSQDREVCMKVKVIVTSVSGPFGYPMILPRYPLALPSWSYLQKDDPATVDASVSERDRETGRDFELDRKLAEYLIKWLNGSEFAREADGSSSFTLTVVAPLDGAAARNLKKTRELLNKMDR